MAGFDRARPLWEYTLVEGLEGGRAAMVLKVHHSMTDGVGGMKLLLMLFDFEREPADPGPLDGVEAIPDVQPRSTSCSKSLGHRRRRVVGMAQRAVVDAVARRRGPRSTTRRVDRRTRPRSAARSRASWRRRPRRTRRSCGRARWPAQLGTLDVPLDDLKRAGKAVGGSLNDAFVAGGASAGSRATTSSTASRSTTCGW